jgi:hypothetical protein
MKRFMTATALLTTMATAAFAYEGTSTQMQAAVANILQEEGLNIPVNSLTDQQVVDIYLADTSSDDQGERRQRIDNALEGEGLTRMAVDANQEMIMKWYVEGENSVVISVQKYLGTLGIEADASTLTDAQVAEIYFIAFGSDESGKKAAVENVLSM